MSVPSTLALVTGVCRKQVSPRTPRSRVHPSNSSCWAIRCGPRRPSVKSPGCPRQAARARRKACAIMVHLPGKPGCIIPCCIHPLHHPGCIIPGCIMPGCEMDEDFKINRRLMQPWRLRPRPARPTPSPGHWPWAPGAADRYKSQQKKEWPVFGSNLGCEPEAGRRNSSAVAKQKDARCGRIFSDLNNLYSRDNNSGTLLDALGGLLSWIR